MLRVVKTENGYVRGIPGNDVRTTVFRGIPFAADPVGENRWRAPQPVENWEGVRDCSRFAPITMQKVPGANPDAFYSKEWHCEPEIAMTEKGSLCLNIWTPTKTGDEKLPVMVWIFGGGLQEGYCHEMEFDGESMNRRGVILVTVAYRLNVFGFLAHPELTAEDPEHPTNFGLLDQQAAIKWVKRNIAAFGGDPDNITIFGQSAGAGSTMYHETSPQDVGLFARAIAQSSGGIVPVYPHCYVPIAITMEEAEEAGVKFVRDVLGCSSIAEARQLDEKLVEQKYWENNLRFTATIDGKFIVDQWYKRVMEGKVNAPLMTGNVGNEFQVRPDADLDAWIKKNFGKHADAYAALVSEAAKGDPEKMPAAATVNGFEVSGLSMAKYMDKNNMPVYYYQFNPTMPGDNAGSFHSSELWFTFETLMKCWRPWEGYHYDLARKMCNYWTNFAKTGDPNGKDANGAPMPEWRKYTAEDGNIMHFNNFVYSTSDPLDKRVQFLLDINLAEYNF